MRRAGIFALSLLSLAACAPEERADTPRAPEKSRGQAIVFRSDVDRRVLALYLDEGSYRYYDEISEVGGPSDRGGYLEPCGEGIPKCVEFASSYYLMAPPGGGDWAFRSFDFHIDTDSSDREGHVVIVSRAGKEIFSYSYSPRCGIEWINFTTGEERPDRLYYPVGRSLFSESVCTSAPHP